MPLFPAGTGYLAILIRFRNRIGLFLRALRIVRPSLHRLFTTYDPSDQSRAQVQPLIEYTELRFALSLYLRDYWAYRMAPMAFVWAGGCLEAFFWLAGLLWAAVGAWVLEGRK